MTDATPRTVFKRAFIATLALGIAVLCNLLVAHSSQALDISTIDLASRTSLTLAFDSNDSNKTTLKSTPFSKKQKNQPVSETPAETPALEIIQPLPQPLATIVSFDVDELADQRLANILTPITAPVTFSSIKAFTPNNHSFALLRPTEQGWKILGVLWYWWTPVLVATWLLFSRLLARAIRVRELKKVVAS